MERELLQVPSGKDLGVILDNNLTYGDHITKNVSLRFSRLVQINRVKHAFNKKILINIIYTLVFSKLLYCSNVWAYILLQENSLPDKGIPRLQIALENRRRTNREECDISFQSQFNVEFTSQVMDFPIKSISQ